MSIIRINKNENYSCISNEGLNDQSLSWGAKGLLAYLLSKPNNWNIILDHLKTSSSDGRDSTRNKLKELEDKGYLVKGNRIRENGKLKGYEYDLYESLRWKTYVGKPTLENPTIVNTDIVNTNNILSKDNNKDSNESFKSKKNVLSYKDASYITKYCLDTFYKKYKILHPKVREKSFYNESKIYECEKIINLFINGFNKTNYSNLRLFLQKKEIDYNIDIGCILDDFKIMFNRALNIYDIKYNPVNKEKLPNHLLTFLYNSFGEFKSYFLYFSYFPVEKIKIEKQRKDKNPKITEVYKQFFKELNTNDFNKLISYVNNIVLEYKKINDIEIEYKNKKHKRNYFEDDNYLHYVGSINKFIILHIEYLKSIQQYKSINFNYLYVGGIYWKQFIDYVKKTYNVSIYLDEKILFKKCKLFIDFKK